MFRVGLTGGIGSGKSTVCRLFSELGVPIIDADQISRELVEPGKPALAALVSQFGPEILAPDGQLDRASLRKLVFADALQRHRLEALLHPLIQQRMLERSATATSPYVILAIPLLFEAGWQALVDRILVIDCPVELQISRTMQRDAVPLAQVESIIASQTERAARLKQADDIITNDSDLAHLQQQIARLHRAYLEQATSADRR